MFFRFFDKNLFLPNYHTDQNVLIDPDFFPRYSIL